MVNRWYIPTILRENSSPLAKIVLENRCEIAHAEQAIDILALTELSSEDIIDRFLNFGGDKRIVAEEGEAREEVKIAASLSEEEDIVSEELATIYLMQGLNDEAIAIYHKLSLLNSEKSVYFAELIAKAQGKR